MNWNVQPATQGQPSHQEEVGRPAQPPPAPPPPESSARPRQGISIGKTHVVTQENGKETEIEVFTMSLGAETIELLPLRNWGQLDTYKWGVRGKLPGTPAGLDIAFDHVKMLGQTASTKEPEGCSKLEGLFNEWLALERENLELAKKKDHPKQRPPAQDSSGSPEQRGAHFRVELDTTGQVHIRRLQGKEIVAEIGLNMPGFSGLSSQGLMRKPRKMQVGVLHDWVELDGELFSFEKGNNDAAKLEKTLNGKYLPEAALGRGKDVVIFANAASSTGFDIQFPVTQAGVLNNRRRPLNEDSLALLQDPNACGVLHKAIVIKLTRPSLVFKLKTPDGGERYLERSAEHTVTVTGDDGGQKLIDLSQPVSYLRLSPVELTAVFNHSAINRHSQAAEAAEAAGGLKQAAPPPPAHEPGGAGLLTAGPTALPPSGEARGQRPPEPACQEAQAAAPAQVIISTPVPKTAEALSQPEGAPAEDRRPVAEPVTEGTAPSAAPSKDAPEQAGEQGVTPAVQAKPQPNSWLENVLAQPPIRHAWLASLVYSKIAERFGNSRDATFGLSRCWAVALDETEDIADPAFKGIFLTEKHGLGFLCREQMARFNQGVAFIGTQESAIQGIGVSLLGVGFDVQQRVVLVITDDYRKKFGVPDQTLAQELGRLEEYGAVIMSVKEVLHSQDPIEVLWTVPAAQENSDDPRIIESIRPTVVHPGAVGVVD
ncbi:MAG: hypothetical protein ABSH34_12750 [Verrucomicrobiota bacterium]